MQETVTFYLVICKTCERSCLSRRKRGKPKKTKFERRLGPDGACAAEAEAEEADCEKEMHFFKCYINIKGIKLEKS